MPPRGVKKGSKRARQYEHVKESQLEQGRSEDRAEEIAARTVNKERARAGESRERSRTSTQDISSGRRGGLRSGTDRAKGPTREQLYNEARKLGVRGPFEDEQGTTAARCGRQEALSGDGDLAAGRRPHRVIRPVRAMPKLRRSCS